jgi:hypothetical protein
MIFRCTWTLADLGGVALTAYKIRMEGITDNPIACYLVSERIDVGVFI